MAGHVVLDWFYRSPAAHQVPFPESAFAYYEATFAEPGRFGASMQLWRTIDQEIADVTQSAKRR